MSSVSQTHALVDQWTATKLAGLNVIYGNTDDSTFAAGDQPYCTQRVVFSASKQLGLGDNTAGRHWGYIIFVIFNPKGKGDAGRNTLLDIVVKSFRSQRIGDVTTQQCRIVSQGYNDQWSITGVQIPFFTEEF